MTAVSDETARSHTPPWRRLWPLIIAGVVGLGVWLIFIWQHDIAAQKHNQLCGTFAAIVGSQYVLAGTKYDPAYYYYLDHPDALKVSKQLDLQILKALDCKPIKLDLPRIRGIKGGIGKTPH